MMAPSGPSSVKRRCRRCLYWIPVLFISIIVCWSYYAYVIQLCIVSMDNIGEKVLCLIAYHFFVLLFVWSYWKTIFTLPMNPTKEFHLSYADKEVIEREPRGESQQDVLRRLAKDLPVYTRTMSGDLQYFIKFWTNGLPDTQAKFHIMFLFFAAAMFSVSLSSLFGYHCWLVCKNRSTLEAFRSPVFRHGTDKNGFSLGISKNLREVFGDEKKYWSLPIFTSLGDGCSFPTCLVNQDPEQASTPSGTNVATKSVDNHQFPAKPLRESQSHLLTNTESWTESSCNEEKGKVGMSNPALTIEKET